MFHCAPPEVNGFGVDHVDARLDQVVPGLDVLRVALADREHHDRVGDDALVLVLVPALVDDGRRPRAASRPARARTPTTSAVRPASTARLWSPDAPYDSLKVTPLPARRLLERRDQLLVGLLRRRVGDEAELAAAAVASGRSVALPAAAGGSQQRDDQSQAAQAEAATSQSHSPPCQSTLPEAGKVAKADRVSGESRAALFRSRFGIGWPDAGRRKPLPSDRGLEGSPSQPSATRSR